MRSVILLALVLGLASLAHAQDDPAFRFGGGPWQSLALLADLADGTVFAASGTSLVVSHDGGLSWTERNASFPLRDLEAAADGTLWAATADGVQRSADGGVTWTLDRAGSSHSLAIDGLDVVALFGDEVWRRRDAVWTQIPVPPPSITPYYNRTVAARDGRVAVGRIAFSPLYPTSSVAWSADSVAGPSSSWYSTHAGGSVNAVAITADGTVYSTATETNSFYSTNPGGVYRAVPNTPSVALTTADAFGAHVRNDGSLWYAIGPSVYRDHVVVATTRAPAVAHSIPTASGLLIGTQSVSFAGFDPPSILRSGSGIYVVRDGREIQTGYAPAAVYSIRTLPGDTLVVGGTAGTVHRLDSDAWVNTGANIALVRQIVLFEGTVEPLVLGAAAVETDGGGSSFALPGAVTLFGSPGYPFEAFGEISAYACLGVRSVLAVPRGPTYGSDAPGLVVYHASGGFETLVPGSDLRALYAAGNNTGYAGAWGAPEYTHTAAAHRIYRTADGGTTWTSDALGVTASEVFAFVAHDGLTLAGTDAGVLSRDGDGLWSAAGLDSLAVRSLAVYQDQVLAGTTNGLYRRAADGAWARYGTGLDGRTVYTLHVGGTPALPWLAVGTDAGVYATRTLVPIATPDTSAAASLRAYPNPARDRLTFDDGLPHATANVFDAFGRQVVTVFFDARGSAQVDTHGLAAGVYLVRVAGDARSVRFTVLR